MANRVTFVLVFVLLALICPSPAALAASLPTRVLGVGLLGHLFAGLCHPTTRPLADSLSAAAIAFGIVASGLQMLWG